MDRNRLTEADREAPRDGDGGDGMGGAERQVIVICEECGKKYSVVPSRIQGSAAGFTCRRCGHRIVVAKPPEALPEGPAPAAEDALEEIAPPRSSRMRLGLRAEMVGIVLVFPLLVMAGAGFVFWQQQEAEVTAELILGGAFLAALLVVLVFGLRLAERVRALADAAARISTGDFTAEVETGSADELGLLAEAVARMRENLRQARERMNR
ncbi:MAG TPA: HAMP domain-containing protein [Desulfobacterales bacterium]|nr:HAMP domain-containing protein [Desulfobacterales bacterium]